MSKSCPALLLAILLTIACSDAGQDALNAGEEQEAAYNYDAAIASYELAASYAESEANEDGRTKLEALRARRDRAVAAVAEAEEQADAGAWAAAVATLEQADSVLPHYTPVTSALDTARVELEANRLGGGFREARWGMSVDAVKQALGGRVQTDRHEFLEIRPSDGGKAKCWFYDGQLYRVEYNPGLGDGDSVAVDGIRSVMAEKYGTPTRVPNRANQMGLPLILDRWSDRNTEITFRVVEPSSTLPRTASTAKAIYVSKAISAAKERGERLTREAAESEALESAKSSSRGRF